MWTTMLALFFHLSGAALWLGGSATLSWVWLPALRTGSASKAGIQLLGRALPRWLMLWRLGALLLLLSGGYRASGFMSSSLPSGKLAGLALMIATWLLLTGLFEMALPKVRRHLAAATGSELGATLSGLARLSQIAFWLSALLLLDGVYLGFG